jgi:excisionase family DNA binding protein
VSADYLTTVEVAEAVEVGKTTIVRWAEKGVLPKPVVIHGGRRGRVARWPLYTPAQARWVQAQLDAHRTWEEIRAALESGEFVPPA